MDATEVVHKGEGGRLQIKCALSGQRFPQKAIFADRKFVSRWKRDLVMVAVEEREQIAVWQGTGEILSRDNR